MDEEKQLIISIGREVGSGGHEIATKLAEIYGLPMYDYNILSRIADDKNVDVDDLKRYDEVSRPPFLSRRVHGFSNSPEEIIANMQFDFLRDRAKNGESFVALGRCSETVLKEFPGLVTIFVLADEDKKIERIARREDLSLEEAKRYMHIRTKKRKMYHNLYSDTKWGDSRNYDLSINSSALGIDGTIKILCDFIDRKHKL